MKVKYDSFSECGPRYNNEDFIAIREFPDQNRSVFVLCDGMGGHDFGEVASRIVAENICDYWGTHVDEGDSKEKVINACKYTMEVYNRLSTKEMGTTMAMVAVDGNKALLAHCGDSRIYFIRDGGIIYQTTDHVALTDEGYSVITRAFFTGRNNFIPDIKEMEIQANDMILICSDGVYGNGKWNALHERLHNHDTENLLGFIKEIAMKQAHDNYSAILIRIEESDRNIRYLHSI